MVLLLASLSSAGALVLHHHRQVPGRVVELGTRAGHAAMQHSKGWDDFGKPPFNFYKGFEEFMAVFPDEDRESYPDMFKMPEGCYEVSLPKPLGIAFEEVVAGQGVVVDYLVEESNAEKCGKIQPGDILIAVTAFKAPSAMSRHERKLIPCRTLPFDTIMGAIGTNAPPRCKDVVLQFMRPKDAPGPTSLIVIDRFLEFFEVPLDHVFRKN